MIKKPNLNSMKYRNKLKSILSFIIFSFLLFGCKKELQISIDNPTSMGIHLKIDDKIYNIEPNELIYCKIKSGNHVLNYSGKNHEIFFDKEKQYMLNPTQCNYVIEEVIFGESKIGMTLEDHDLINRQRNKMDGLDRMLIDTISISINKDTTISLVGLYRKTNELVIEKIWNYDIKQDIPDQITVETNEIQQLAGPQAGRIKIFREADFVKGFLKQRLVK
jgi:hypothetical protein